jgi:tRNA-dihydrouridine synthase B
MSDSVNNPISAKIRIGFSKDHINALEVSRLIEDAGASLLTVHGRTTDQMYSGIADWSVISEVKSSLSIPVAGNGDIFSHFDALDKRLSSGVDYVAIGRGASGNPLIFQDVRNAFNGLDVKTHSLTDRFAVFREYLQLAEDYGTSFMHQKIQAQHFTKGLFNSSKARLKISSAKDGSELLSAVESLFLDSI